MTDHDPPMRVRLADRPLTYIAAGLLLALATALVYANTLNSPFTFDDLSKIPENPNIRLRNGSIGGILDVLKTAGNRPIPTLSFALNYLLDGYDPFGYHLVNIIIHALTGFLLFLFVGRTIALCDRRAPASGRSRRLPGNGIAFLAALLWVVHPVNTQSVTYVVQRMNSMAAMFCLLSLLLYVAGRSRSGRRSLICWGSAAVCWLLAVASKENAAILPFVVLIYEWYFYQDLSRSWLKSSLKYVLIALVLLGVLAFIFLGTAPIQKLSSLRDFSEGRFTYGQRVLTQPRVIVTYLSLFLFPHPSRLNIDYDFPVSRSLLDPLATLSAAIFLALFFTLGILTARKQRIVSFCIVWFFATLAIESSFLPLGLIFEHRTYMPFMGLSLMTVILMDRYVKPWWVKAAIAGLVICTTAIWTYQRNAVWKDPVALWQDCVEKSPRKARAHLNLGLALAQKAADDRAMAHYRMAVDLDPDYAEAYNNIGNIHARRGDYAEAEKAYREAIRRRPAFAKPHNNLGAALFKLERHDEAQLHLKEALRLDPDFAEAYANLGDINLAQGQKGLALEAFQSALELSPQLARVHSNIGKLYTEDGDFAKARSHFEQALENDPGNAEFLVNMGKLLQDQGHIRQALDYYIRAVAAVPENAAAHNNLANANMALGEKQKAEEHYRKALDLDPSLVEAHANLGLLLAARGDTAGALVHYHQAISLDPTQANVHNNIGNILAEQGDFAAAVGHYREAIRLNPQLDDAQVNLGIVLLRQGDASGAEQAFKTALAINPSNERALQGLAARRPSEASPAAPPPEALHRQAVEHAGRGEYDQAIRLFKQIIERMPSEPGTSYNIACMYALKGDAAAAMDWLEKAVKSGYDNWEAIRNDPDLEALRTMEAFKALLREHPES